MEMGPEKTTEEILTEEKTQLFLGNMGKNKRQQLVIIAQCTGAIDYAKGQIALQEMKREAAQKLLEEMESRYPEVTPEPEEVPE